MLQVLVYWRPLQHQVSAGFLNCESIQKNTQLPRISKPKRRNRLNVAGIGAGKNHNYNKKRPQYFQSLVSLEVNSWRGQQASKAEKNKGNFQVWPWPEIQENQKSAIPWKPTEMSNYEIIVCHQVD